MSRFVDAYNFSSKYGSYREVNYAKNIMKRGVYDQQFEYLQIKTRLISYIAQFEN